MQFKDREDEMAGLRKVALRMTWDGQSQPAVWCPLGDFFGTAPGVNLYKSLLTGMTKDGFYSYWYMPFAKSALVELVNEDTAGRHGGDRDRPRPAGPAVRRAWAISMPSGIAIRSCCPRTAGPTGSCCAPRAAGDSAA